MVRAGSKSLITLILLVFFVGFAARADEAADSEAPLPLPSFSDPYAALSPLDLESELKPLPASKAEQPKSKELKPQDAVQAPAEGAGVELRLPKNLCEAGTMVWGSRETGYRSCKALGRGQTVFGSLRLLGGLKKTQSSYKSWIIGETPMSLRSTIDIKHREHFGTDTHYDYCMYRPDTETNGASIHERPDSSIGRFTLDTGPSVHRGKQKWGELPGGTSRSRRYIAPVRLTRVPDERNRAYRSQGRLTSRDDLWIHSHEMLRNEAPLEGLSTWGCPRLPQACQIEFQAWVLSENAAGRHPLLRIVQE
jgi:hypothetical protein